MLERAGLIGAAARRSGGPAGSRPPLKEVTEWAEHFRRFWDESYARLDDYLDQMKENES